MRHAIAKRIMTAVLPTAGCTAPWVGADGNLVDSALGISRLGSAAITGTFKCGDSADSACRLLAETETGIGTNAPRETLRLKGIAKALTGTLGVRGQNTTFALKTGESDE
jgi:hypothetical protein